jgi:hypothetical protein
MPGIIAVIGENKDSYQINFNETLKYRGKKTLTIQEKKCTILVNYSSKKDAPLNERKIIIASDSDIYDFSKAENKFCYSNICSIFHIKIKQHLLFNVFSKKLF